MGVMVEIQNKQPTERFVKLHGDDEQITAKHK